MKILDFAVVFLAGALTGLAILTGFAYLSEIVFVNAFNIFCLTSSSLLTTFVYIRGRFKLRKLRKTLAPKELEESLHERAIIIYGDEE